MEPDAVCEAGALSLAQALAAVQDAPMIACLAGTDGATLIWSEEPAPCGIAWSDFALPSVARGAADADVGRTWGAPPAGSCLVQLDYEWPGTPPLILPAVHRAQWDAAGACRLLGPDREVLDWMHDRLRQSHRAPEPVALIGLGTAWPERWHRAGVRTLQGCIADGDCYQANLGVPISADLVPGRHRDLAAFLALIQRSPAPFSGFFRAPGRPSVVSHSPECLLAARGDALVSVPIKGTRRRIPGSEEAVRSELLEATKDDAELAMIVDLVRNDLGRVAAPGSVRVDDARQILDLPYVHHRAARILATLAPGRTYAEAIASVFPAGSITGAPKAMAMRRLQALEGCRRGAWCGTFGWLAADGLDLAVAIRTAEIDGARLRTMAGGGIVADSDPAAEWDEVMAKVSGMMRALS